jgi:ribosome-binding ATPase YchF (GTP1/OBG family)
MIVVIIGLVGAPNKGKSTLFSAMTLNEVQIADYPFTTINPNKGVAYATKKCVHQELRAGCSKKNPQCIDGTRLLPINVTDVAGLVEGAAEGKGMGNQFMNDLANADCLIIVTDASGRTDPSGSKTVGADPVVDVRMVKQEISKWISSRTVQKSDKKVFIAANKYDVAGSEKNVDALKKEFGEDSVIGCSGAMELALRKAAKQGLIDYMPGARDFKWLKEDPSKERQEALKYMQNFIREKGTNVQELLNKAAFELLDLIVVYPVEDENKWSDHSGNVLPDAVLLKRGSTALQLAEKIHTDIAKGMLYAVNARTKMRVSKDYVLKDNDVIKIVSTAK